MLRIDKLSYDFKGRKLLKDVSFQLRKGEVLALLGANGAGKSTLMRLLSRELVPERGVIELFGKNINEFDGRELSRCRAMLNQQNHLSLAFTVKEIVMMGRYPHFKSHPSNYDQQIVDEVMEVCGVERFVDRVYLSLSGGEQQRVQLARVLTQIWDNPDSLLLLDEPISALDLYYQQKVLAIAKALSSRGFMVVVVLHDVNFAASYADRIIMLKNGRKLFDGTPIEVLNKQDIYTVFSVETEVAININTLKPNVQLEEMVLDVDVFNSTVALPNQQVSLSDRIKSILVKNPYASYRDLCRDLEVSSLDITIHDQRHKMVSLKSGIDKILADLISLEPVQSKIENRACQLTKRAKYDTCQLRDRVCHVTKGNDRVQVKIEHCHQVLAVQNHIGKSLRFFNPAGEEIYAVVLGDHVYENEFFTALCDKDGESVAIELSTAPRSTGSLLIEEAYSKIIPYAGIDSVDSFAHIIHRETSSRQIHLKQFKADEAQVRDVSFLKRMLNACVQHNMDVYIFIQNAAIQYRYVGTIQNLIDQGDRYIVKNQDMDLTIFMNDIHEVWSVVQPLTRAHLYSLELFDKEGNLVLQLLKEDDGSEITAVWKKIWGVEGALI